MAGATAIVLPLAGCAPRLDQAATPDPSAPDNYIPTVWLSPAR